MLSAIHHTPDRIDHLEAGTGGRPPVDDWPTGGGGGGGDDGSNDNLGGPRELLFRVRALVFLVLSADLIAILALSVVFAAASASSSALPRTVHSWRLPLLLFADTLLLLASSVTMERARRLIFNEMDALEEWLGLGRPAMARARPWLVATLALGSLFAAFQWYIWSRLTAPAANVFLMSPSGTAYFTAALQLHGAHLATGLLLLLGALLLLGRLRRVELRQVALDAIAWIWQCVTLSWLVLLLVQLISA